MKYIQVEELQKALWVSIKFHQNNQNDPHGISNAVMTALIEVSNAISKSTEDDAKACDSKTKETQVQ